MESQNNYPPQQVQDNSSGVNTVLIVIVILILAGFGYWWYTNREVPAPAEEEVGINVTLPFGDKGGTTQ
ncbi:MAG: hypothetical protein RJA61_422 [Candidatus Parcubacteria bacterium]|jgi:multidrug resistance efflux pump